MSTRSNHRVGVIGLGWAGRTHVAAHQSLPGAEVVAISCAEPELLDEVGDSCAIAGRHLSWEALVARDDIDAISIATPNHLHLPIALAALSSGKHVLCEKPLARTGQEAREMSTEARTSGRVLMTCFDKRYRGDVQHLLQEVRSGALGELYYVKASWMRRNRVPPGGSWFTNRSLAGGGPLIDLGIHVLDLALLMLGEPRPLTVSASTANALNAPRDGELFDVEDFATALIRFDSGAVLHLETSWATHGSMSDDFGLQLFGTKGGATLHVPDYAETGTLTLHRDVGGAPADFHPEIAHPVTGHAQVIRQFHQAIRSGSGAGHTGQEGVSRAALIDACYASAVAQHEVALDASGPP